ncbi:hypothetical protein GFS60_01988 [Rhodococcus sp. WAY2]|nr:hypothetical protein GFS60_01988 [Rhodococcus sp. WAY2]
MYWNRIELNVRSKYCPGDSPSKVVTRCSCITLNDLRYRYNLRVTERYLHSELCLDAVAIVVSTVEDPVLSSTIYRVTPTEPRIHRASQAEHGTFVKIT